MPIEPLHGRREGIVLDVQDEVVVRRHQAERETADGLALHGRAEKGHELDVVVGVAEEGQPAGSTDSNVVDTRFRRTWTSWHTATMTDEMRRLCVEDQTSGVRHLWCLT